MAKKASNMNNLALIGRWAFVIGLLIAILSGIPGFPELKGIMLLLGIIVGLLKLNGINRQNNGVKKIILHDLLWL